MNEAILQVNYIIDGTLCGLPTKMIYMLSDESDIESVYFEVTIKNQLFISKSFSDTESALHNLQKVLPQNISIACCQSCRHGNYCPFGSCDNEIFCFKDMTPRDKPDVCDFFTRNYDSLEGRQRKLYNFCTDYKPICHSEYYTYNDWMYKD